MVAARLVHWAGSPECVCSPAPPPPRRCLTLVHFCLTCVSLLLAFFVSPLPHCCSPSLFRFCLTPARRRCLTFVSLLADPLFRFLFHRCLLRNCFRCATPCFGIRLAKHSKQISTRGAFSHILVRNSFKNCRSAALRSKTQKRNANRFCESVREPSANPFVKPFVNNFGDRFVYRFANPFVNPL